MERNKGFLQKCCHHGITRPMPWSVQQFLDQKVNKPITNKINCLFQNLILLVTCKVVLLIRSTHLCCSDWLGTPLPTPLGPPFPSLSKHVSQIDSSSATITTKSRPCVPLYSKTKIVKLWNIEDLNWWTKGNCKTCTPWASTMSILAAWRIDQSNTIQNQIHQHETNRRKSK